MTPQFRVIISGRTISGVPLAEVKAEVGRVFKLQGEQLERLLCGKPMVVSRSSTAEAADKLLQRLQALDLIGHVEPLAEALQSPAPVSPARVEMPKAPQSEELFVLSGPGAIASAAKSATASDAGTTASPAPPGNTSALSAPPAATAILDMEVVCPKCGEAQPKRTLCRKCGLDMPRFLAAQEVVEREAREERAAELEARRQSPRAGRQSGREQQHASVFGIGFSGRLGRLDYFSSSLISSTIWLLMIILAVSTGKTAFVGFGLFISSIYGIRCVALRLHDTGRSGWLALIALVPILGALMALVLLFVGGEEDDNDYGPMPTGGGGGRAVVVLVVLCVVSMMSYRSITQSPENAKRFLETMSAKQGNKALAAENQPVTGPQAAVRYASNNRIDIYVMAGCSSCDQMRSWLNDNGLHYTVYTVDSDEQAAQRLHSIIAGDGQSKIQLPVLEVNGKVLPGNPDIDEVHGQLRQEAS